MAKLRRAKLVLVVFAAGATLSAVSAIAYLHHAKAVSLFQEPTVPRQQTIHPVDQADANDSSSGGPLALGRFGCNSPAPPPILFWGRSSREGDGPDLRTPAAAMQTVLSLIDEGATEKLASCVLGETDHATGSLYPRYLGQPVGLVEVIEDDDSATAVWEAAVHTSFSAQGKRWSPGDTMMLTSRLVRVEGLWKLVQLHDGGEDGSGQDRSAN